MVTYVLGVRSEVYVRGLGETYIYDTRQTGIFSAIASATAAAADTDEKKLAISKPLRSIPQTIFWCSCGIDSC